MECTILIVTNANRRDIDNLECYYDITQKYDIGFIILAMWCEMT